MSALAAWGCSVVGIGFVSSSWLMGLIVDEDPVSRVSVTLSKERNLAESHSVDYKHPALGLVAARKPQPSAVLPAYPETA